MALTRAESHSHTTFPVVVGSITRLQAGAIMGGKALGSAEANPVWVASGCGCECGCTYEAWIVLPVALCLCTSGCSITRLQERGRGLQLRLAQACLCVASVAGQGVGASGQCAGAGARSYAGMWPNIELPVVVFEMVQQ